MSFIDTLLDKSRLSHASRFQALNGIIYLGAGLGIIVWPGLIQVVFRDSNFTGHESGLFRALGLTIAVIGWHYYFGGRSGSKQVIAAGLIERLIYVPLVLLPLAFVGIFSHTFVAFTALDVGLAIRAAMLLRAERAHEPVRSLGNAL
jgi:hypothetical protein